MRSVWRLCVVGCSVVCSAAPGCSKEQPNGTTERTEEERNLAPDVEALDRHLKDLDSLSRDEAGLSARVRANRESFETALARLLRAADRRAPARLVFYAVALGDDGDAIAVDSELGRACAATMGSGFSIATTEKGVRVYDAGDFYLWWESHRQEYEALALLDEWISRPSSQEIAIPLFRASKRK